MTILGAPAFYPNINMADGLTAIKDFALSNGWSVVYYGLLKQWGSIGGGQYDWIAGNHGILMLETNQSINPAFPHPNQTLHFRIKFENINSVLTHEYASINTPPVGSYPITFPNDSSIDPVDGTGKTLNDLPRFRRVSLNPQGNMRLWIYGNSHQIIAHFAMDSQKISTIWIGTIELFDVNEANGGLVCNAGGSDTYGINGYWDEQNWINYQSGIGRIQDGDPTASTVCPILYRGALTLKSAGNVCTSSDISNASRFAVERRLALYTAKYSNKLGMARGLCYMYETIHTTPVDRYQQYFPFGTLPFWWCNRSNLPIGAEVTFGSQTFHVFPRASTVTATGVERSIGYAFRVV